MATMSESIDTPYAAAPFDHPKADIILRSSDNVDFRVFKLFLSLASPFFETLFDIPEPTQASGKEQEVRDGLAVIPVTEGSETLNALLRFCYPCTLADDPDIKVLKDALDVLEAARKYSLDAVEKKAHQAIMNPKFLKDEPLRCFAIAHQGRLAEETLLAAKYTLTGPLIPLWFKEIELISASDLLSLLTYHRKCGDAVYALRLDISWITSHYGSAGACNWLSGQREYKANYNDSVTYASCECPGAGTTRYTLFGYRSLKWWDDFMEETFTELRDRPCKETVRDLAEDVVKVVKTRKCQACSPKITEGMRGFVGLFERKVEETVSRIKLELKCR